MEKIATFGEIILCLVPNGYNYFFQDDQLQVTFGGGEANVAVSLVNYGMHAVFMIRLPSHTTGQGAINTPRALGADTSHIVRGGDRVDIYYLEKDTSRRDSVRIHDRAYSTIQQARAEDLDWDNIFEGAVWLHFTGITPALGGNLVGICLQACQTVKAKGARISCDLNYRDKLWSRAQTRIVMTELCRHVDVCVANEEDAKDIFSIEVVDSDTYGGELNKSGYESVARQLAGQFGFEKVAIMPRTSLFVSDNNWAGILYDDTECHVSKEYHLHIADRVGSGDSFADGLTYTLLSGKLAQDTTEFAVAASALKRLVERDFSRVTCNEVEKLASGGGSGRVQRQTAVPEKLQG